MFDMHIKIDTMVQILYNKNRSVPIQTISEIHTDNCHIQFNHPSHG